MTSYETQTYQAKTLLILYDTARENIASALEAGCRALFDLHGCKYIAVWDDDDYSPPDRLEKSVAVLDKVSRSDGGVVGYDSGWFCSLRTLRGEYVDVAKDGHLWGGSLMFDKVTWNRAGGFLRAPVPGYDRYLQNAAWNRLSLPVDGSRVDLPIAFCHGKNMATFLRTKGELLEDHLHVMPEAVNKAVWAAHNYFVEHRIYVPQPEV